MYSTRQKVVANHCKAKYLIVSEAPVADINYRKAYVTSVLHHYSAEVNALQMFFEIFIITLEAAMRHV